MGVLLGLGDVQLAPAGRLERAGETGHDLRREGHEDRQVRLVLRHRHDEEVIRRWPAVRRGAVEAVERRIGEGVGQLPRPVRAEVGVHDGLAIDDRSVRALDHGRSDELVVHAPLV